LDENNAHLIFDFFESIHFTNARHIKKVLRKYYLIKIYLEEKGIDIKDKNNVLLILYLIILNIYYSDEYNYIIQKDKEKIYQNIIFFYYDRNGLKKQGRYNVYKKNCNIRYKDDTEYNIHNLLVRFSSHKIVNNEIKSSMHFDGETYTELEDWLGAFEPNNICNQFIKFILNNKGIYKNLMKDHEIDDDKIIALLNIVNDII